MSWKALANKIAHEGLPQAGHVYYLRCGKCKSPYISMLSHAETSSTQNGVHGTCFKGTFRCETCGQIFTEIHMAAVLEEAE